MQTTARLDVYKRQVCETVSAIRSTRARYGISPKTQLAVAVKAGEDDIARLEAQRGLIEGMGNVASLQMAADVELSLIHI